MLTSIASPGSFRLAYIEDMIDQQVEAYPAIYPASWLCICHGILDLLIVAGITYVYAHMYFSSFHVHLDLVNAYSWKKLAEMEYPSMSQGIMRCEN